MICPFVNYDDGNDYDDTYFIINEFNNRHLSAPRGYKLENVRKVELQEGMGNSDDEEDRRMLHVPLRKNRPKRTNNFRNKMENWENAEVVYIFFFLFIFSSFQYI